MTQINRSVLIGHTGFVGSTLKYARPFDAFVNSKTIQEITGQRFDLIVCAGVSAVKWLANKNPETDRAGIARLTSVLETVVTREFVLISTIDTYPNPGEAANEDMEINPAVNHAYGRHRLDLEQWIQARFETVRIIRLPALFGAGLKKNLIFDLLHDHQTEAINPASILQWYPLRRLADDIDRVRSEDIRLINLFPEPIRTADILAAFFGAISVGEAKHPAPHYKLETKYAALFGGPKGYIADRRSILGDLADFIITERGRAT
jgi:dTDP-4-dehydrorhamnose reductase